ncbi:MAG TPA: M48 family metallopeptidase, partial [Longimicrobiaceae bacterium]|nr:M48 family metallopeptidase [Longimicrobiaceae bacterium]
MDPYLFRERSARFERLARRSRVLYRALLVLLVALGYVYLAVVVGSIAFLLLLVLLLVVASRNVFAAARLLGPAGSFSARVGRALWVRIDPPDGLRVTPEQAPALFAAVEEVRRALRTRRVHTVLLTSEVNASLAQVPRLGILGWHRNYLSLGLPLLQGLSPEHARAVVAHELAHLSRQHSRMGGWVHRVMETWHRLVERVEENARPKGALGAFFRWYVPFLDAFTRVESRASELEADALAARVVGADALGAALARTAVISRYHNEVFWPWFEARTAERPVPFHGPFAARTMAPAPDAGAAWVQESLAKPDNPFFSHPELRTRLDALGV